MPNWVKNRVTIVGSKESVSMFKQKAKSRPPIFGDTFKEKPWGSGWKTMEDVPFSEFEFHGIVPLPDIIRDNSYSSFGYNAEREAWGIKWGASNAQMFEHNDCRLTYTYNTPWDIGIKFWEKASALFPDLYFFLSAEEEDSQRGRFIIHNGEFLGGIAWERYEWPETETDEDEDRAYEGLERWWQEFTGEAEHNEWVLTETIERKLTWESMGTLMIEET